jgi:hypothetical protein
LNLGKKKAELLWDLTKTHLPTPTSPLGSFFLFGVSERFSKRKRNYRGRRMAEKIAVMILQAPAVGGFESKHPVPCTADVCKHFDDVCKHSDV